MDGHSLQQHQLTLAARWEAVTLASIRKGLDAPLTAHQGVWAIQGHSRPVINYHPGKWLILQAHGVF